MLINKIKRRILLNKNWRNFFNYIKNNKEYNECFNDKNDDINASKAIIYDVLDNKGFAKLIKNIVKLKNNSDYEVNVEYRSRILGTYDYIRNNIDSRSYGIVATIRSNSSEWINSITISYTTLSLYEYLISYSFEFANNRIITSKIIHEFVINNENELGNYKKYFIVSNLLLGSKYCRDYFELEKELFEFKLQSIIINLFYTDLGKKYFLPVEYLMVYKKVKKIISEFEKHGTFCDLYSNGKQIIIMNDVTNCRHVIENINSGITFPSSIVDTLVGRYGLEVYYKVFYKIEIDKLEKMMRKYYNSKIPFICNGDIKYLIKKSTFVNAYEEKFNINYYKKIYKEDFRWKHFSADEWEKDGLVSDKVYALMFSKLFEENLSYLQSLSSSQINYWLLFIAFLTLLTTFFSVFDKFKIVFLNLINYLLNQH